MVNIAVLVSGGGTNLQTLIDHEKAGGNPYGKLRLVVSSRADAYALTRARDYGLETAVCAKRDYPDGQQHAKFVIELMEAHDIDVIVLAGFLTIMHEDFTNRFAGRIINVHPALIPAFSGKGFYGLRVHEAALARGVKITGATVHLVDEVVDGGKILMQKAVEVREDDTPEILQRRVMEEAEWVILPQALTSLCKELSET